MFHLLKNVGIDIFKPDMHVKRLLGKIGVVRIDDRSVLGFCKAMTFLSTVTGMRINEIDSLLYYYGQLTADSVEYFCN